MGYRRSTAGITVRCATTARYCSENKGKKSERNDLVESDRVEFWLNSQQILNDVK